MSAHRIAGGEIEDTTMSTNTNQYQDTVAAGLHAYQSGVPQWDAFAKTYLAKTGQQIMRAVSEYATEIQIRRAMMQAVSAA